MASGRLRVMLAGMAVVLGTLVLAACGGSDSESSKGSDGTTAKETGPIVIGAAVDQTKLMKFFDGPALTAAKIRADEINAQGGVDGRKIEFKVLNTRLDPDRTRSAAIELTDGGADIMWATCDADWATPAMQVGISKGLLTVAPCEGTGQIGPKRFGEQGKLAFSFGNFSGDEAAALAKVAIDRGLKTAVTVTDKSITYTQLSCAAFKTAFEELGGKVVGEESFTEGDRTIGRVVTRVNRIKADLYNICATTQQDLPAFVSGIRGLGNDTPIYGPWSIDSAFWLPKSPKVSNNITLVTYASVYGDDPNDDVKALIAKMTEQKAPPATGGFLGGAAAVDAIAWAVKENGGSTDGAALAKSLEGAKDLETTVGKISFSPELHTVFGREYRIIDIKDGKPGFAGLVKADHPVNLP